MGKQLRPDQTPQNEQGLHCLHTNVTIKISIKKKDTIQQKSEITFGLNVLLSGNTRMRG